MKMWAVYDTVDYDVEIFVTKEKADEYYKCYSKNSLFNLTSPQPIDVPTEYDVLKVILEKLEEKLHEPQYQHEGETWENGLIIAQDIIELFIGGKHNDWYEL